MCIRWDCALSPFCELKFKSHSGSGRCHLCISSGCIPSRRHLFHQLDKVGLVETVPKCSLCGAIAVLDNPIMRIRFLFKYSQMYVV